MIKTKPVSVFIALALSLLGASAAAKTNTRKAPPLNVVSNVDLQKYMGLWYEIASIPAWFQKNCAGGTTAEYSLNNDGSVKVVNSCYTSDKKLKQAIGKAWIVDKTTNAKLKVSFVPGKSKALAGDYWIIDIGPDYQYAIVGHPKRSFGWILSRTKELPQDILDKITSSIERHGYDINNFVFTNQKDFAE